MGITFCRKFNLNRSISTSEIRFVKLLLIQENQAKLEISDNFNNLKNSLRLQKDSNNIYLSSSRISNARSLSHDAKNPIILYRNHRLTELLVWDAHNRIKHLGERKTLAEIRSRYWIPRGKSFVKKVLHRCITCKRFNSRPYSYPKSPKLPEVRLNDGNTFNRTGIDYLGPLYCKDIYGRNTLDDCDLFKGYVVLYTCASTRGVILELAPDASSKYFVYSLRKFISRRGCPRKILTDNGTVFTSQETQKFATNRNIEWQFSLFNASWYGGFWERLVSIVKRCLKKTVGKACLNFYELQIILSKIEMIINSRTLNALHDEEMYEIMKPNHLLLGRKLYQENPN